MKLKTKFDIGDEVYFLFLDKIRHGIIEEISVTFDVDRDHVFEVCWYTCCYEEDRICKIESNILYGSKEELIKSLLN